VQENLPDHERAGLSVLQRRGRDYHDVAADLSERLFAYCSLGRRERIELRNQVERRSWELDWAKLGGAYHRAHDLALELG
jgi:hypothetical protein